MKFSKKSGIILASCLISAGLAVSSIITATEYSAEDPLISKSWIDGVFYPQIVQYVDAKIEELRTLLPPASVENTDAETVPEDPEAEDSQTSVAEEVKGISYEVITLTSGQLLTSSEGSLEVILRPGASATVYSEIEGNGIADLTSGTELLGGAAIPINAYCLIPRADGRGVLCTSEIAYVMVRGKYEIK